ncbi:hypothetical protein [Methylobacter sp. YRD-M1]|uniref:hypothetical protein n=1 Tax=Methylobacter sp. YRD-M1 TaxID=2911520 RepID=UPI00227BA1B0|nr:hypothetical protein [Methylobacter sp. YRD-M1]WAK01843.1 hypothetical protein LZ558_18820 [Methylobacter sp. YRD-M1]
MIFNDSPNSFCRPAEELKDKLIDFVQDWQLDAITKNQPIIDTMSKQFNVEICTKTTIDIRGQVNLWYSFDFHDKLFISSQLNNLGCFERNAMLNAIHDAIPHTIRHPSFYY